MTQVDGVQTSEQFDFGPFKRPPGGARRRRAEDGRDRAQRQLGALRQRRPRRRRVALHQGPGRLPRRAGNPPRRQDDLGRPLRRRQRQPGTGRRHGDAPGLRLRERSPRQRDPQQGHRRDGRRCAHGSQSAGHRGYANSGQARLHSGAGQHAPDDGRGLRHARRDGVVLGPRPAGLRPLPVRHRGLGRARHPGPFARLGRSHPGRPRTRPALLASLRAVQRHVAGHRPRADDLRLRSAVSLPAARHARLRAGRLRHVAAGPAVDRRSGARSAPYGRRQLQERLLRHPARPERDPRDHPGTGADEPDLPHQVLPGEHRRRGRRLPAGRASVRPSLLRARRALRPFRARRQPERPVFIASLNPEAADFSTVRCPRSSAWRRISPTP